MFKSAFTYYIKVFGCQMNYVDAEIIVSTLNNIGGKLIEDETSANVIVVVTCGVRAGAEERIVSWTKKQRNQNKDSAIVMTGCLSHRKDIENRLDGIVNYFIPIDKWASFVSYVILAKAGIQDYLRKNKDLPVILDPRVTPPAELFGREPEDDKKAR